MSRPFGKRLRSHQNRRAVCGRFDPYAVENQPEPVDEELIALLRARDGVETVVELRSGVRLRVWDIAWGYDALEDRAHVTTNISPGAPDRPLDVFGTRDVVAMSDPRTETVLWRADGMQL